MHELGHNKADASDRHGHDYHPRSRSPIHHSSNLSLVKTTHSNLQFPAQPRVAEARSCVAALHTDNAIRIKANATCDLDLPRNSCYSNATRSRVISR